MAGGWSTAVTQTRPGGRDDQPGPIALAQQTTMAGSPFEEHHTKDTAQRRGL